MPSLKERLERIVSEMIENGVKLDEAVRDFERKSIAMALKHANGSRSTAAKSLGIHRNTLRRKSLSPAKKSAPRKRSTRRSRPSK
jgi:DNA-binding NtrC family response regulator